MSGIEDRLLVERLLNMHLVPFSLEPSERMKKLLMLFATVDENAGKAFVEVFCYCFIYIFGKISCSPLNLNCNILNQFTTSRRNALCETKWEGQDDSTI